MGWLLAPTLALAEVVVPAGIELQPPAAAWLQTTLREDGGASWREIESAAAAAAFAAAEANHTHAMEGWLFLTRWSRLLGEDQRAFTNRWVDAINAARLGHSNMPRRYDPPAATLSSVVSVEFAVTVVSDFELSQTFFDLVTPYDHLPNVLGILNALHADNAADFAEYGQLALAIALVFDVPPPPSWPHAQVGAEVLPRRSPEPLEAFRFWVAADRSEKTLHRLNRLAASELKFLVATAAPFPELRWAQEQVRYDFINLPRAYDAVRYRDDRLDSRIFVWSGDSYALPEILAQGGICVDQAYFATEVAKARGVPALLFNGAGSDGRHAWFGYLDHSNRWQFDVGRYAEQRFVVGKAFDPQTWDYVNDHELAFLAERFRLLPAYRQSRARQYLAQEYLRRGDALAAMTEAQRAVNHEPRNVAAWETLNIAQQAANETLVKREFALRQAARAFARYPDLNARFMREVIGLLRERGQTSAADHAERQLARKFTADRSDLAIAQAAEMINRTFVEDSPSMQLRVFESALRQYGTGAGIEAFDRLVRPFCEQLIREERAMDAARVIAITRRLVPIEPGSQFDDDLKELAARLP